MTTLVKNMPPNLLFSQDEAVECNGGGGVLSVKKDANGNRTHENGIKVAEYDAQDRLTSYKDNSYQYNALGQLTQKTTPNGTDSFNYDVFGNLRGVSLANGDSIEYLIDPKNRRIGKKVNGQITQKLLYQDQLNPIAELYANNSVKNLFIYAEKSNVPSAMERYDESGNLIGKYRIISNHLGSVVMVVNAETGTIEQEIKYDVWGNVLSDTNPNFQPFYFAGGLYDTDTQLTRFGARDYDAETGRWTAKDPIGFNGGLTSLYDYVGGDPVNFVDPSGLQTYSLGVNADAGLGVGVTIGINSVHDSHGNHAGMVTLGIGGSSPNLSVSAQGEYTNADTVYDLAGWGGETGGSLAAGDASYMTGNGYNGVTGGVSAGTDFFLPTINGYVTYTFIIPVRDYDPEIDNPEFICP